MYKHHDFSPVTYTPIHKINRPSETTEPQLSGRVVLYYSEDQRQDHVTYCGLPYTQSRDIRWKAGANLALDKITGEIFLYTDIKVMEGDATAILHELAPLAMPRPLNPATQDEIYTDLVKVHDVDPKNLILLKSVFGQTLHIVSKDVQ